MFYRKASVAVLVYDITDMDSFEGLKGWVRELMQNADRPVGECFYSLHMR